MPSAKKNKNSWWILPVPVWDKTYIPQDRTCRTCIALCLRPGDSGMSALTWKNIELANGLALVCTPKVHSMKTVCPPPWSLEEAKQRRRNDDDYVCHNLHGNRLRRSTMAVVWYRVCAAIGVRIAMFSMRHIAASAMLESGADPISVAAQPGHSTVATTIRYYAHVRAKKQIEAAPNTVKNNNYKQSFRNSQFPGAGVISLMSTRPTPSTS